jgi:endonuclease III
MKNQKAIKILMDHLGKKFSTSLGIDLSQKNSDEIFKWFLASILFGARIKETIVIKTYKEFEKEGVLTPEDILKTGWDGLVQILDAGGYVRYDFKTATKLLEIMKSLKKKYDGDLNLLHSKAKDSKDLEQKIKDLGKGIGEVTVNIFLRELRGIWYKAQPLPADLVLEGAKHLGFIFLKVGKEKSLTELKKIWEKNKIKGKDFSDFESALVRLSKDFCRKKKCEICLVKDFCKK